MDIFCSDVRKDIHAWAKDRSVRKSFVQAWTSFAAMCEKISAPRQKIAAGGNLLSSHGHVLPRRARKLFDDRSLVLFCPQQITPPPSFA